MIKAYKEYKKMKYEKNLLMFIELNNKRIEEYQSDLPLEEILREDSSICRNYSKSFLKEINEKYNVDIDLINRAILSEENTIASYDKKEMEEELAIKEKEEEEKIRLYKKAILELKREDKL